MTSVADDKLAQYLRFNTDITRRILDGSLDPDTVMGLLRSLIGQRGIPSLSEARYGVVVPQLDYRFVPRDHFDEGTSGIRYIINDSFRAHVLTSDYGRRTHLNSIPPISLELRPVLNHVHDVVLRRALTGTDWSSSLYSTGEIMWIIASLTMRQPLGEKEGVLRVPGRNLIGYVACEDGLPRAVFTSWLNGTDQGWFLSVGGLDSVHQPDTHVFCRI